VMLRAWIPGYHRSGDFSQHYRALVVIGVRDARAEDAAAVAAIYRPYVVDSPASFEVEAPDAGEVLVRMRASPQLPWLVADSDDGVVGYAYATRHRSRSAYRWAVDCSVYVQAGQGGRGIGRHLYSGLLQELRDLGYHQAFAGIALPNPASVGLHEAMGFEPVGVYKRVGYKHGVWHDVGWWQLPLAASGVDAGVPREPKPWRPINAT